MSNIDPYTQEAGNVGQHKQYTVAQPHPMFGKDPNIVNEFGHTKYPKYIDSNEKDKSGFPVRVIVNSEKEEKELLAKDDKDGKGKNWPK